MEFNVRWNEKKIATFQRVRLMQIFHRDIFRAKDQDDLFGNKYDHLLDQVAVFDSLMSTSGVKTVWIHGEIYNGENYIADVIGVFAVEEV